MNALGIPTGVFTRARRAAAAFTALTGVPVDAAELLTGRAALLGLAPRGRISAGGATRLLAGADGWWALTLSRPDDLAAVPAMLEADTVPDDPWPALRAWSAGVETAAAVARARLLGLPAAVLGEAAPGPVRVRRIAPRAERPLAGRLVVDLTSMWAGPLCGRLLARAGATVVKVEHPDRPDGTRAGAPAFFDWVNGGKRCCAYTFDDPEFAGLLAAADVVLEASRPGALERRGLGPDDAPGPDGRIRVRITGHGAAGPAAEWVAFGDDAAVAGGLVAHRGDGPVFCGDAIADPLTGLHAALAVAESVRRGGGELLELTLAGTAAGYAALPDETGAAPADPVAPVVGGRAPALGADQDEVRRLVQRRVPC
ncbi:CoA transferase [uncultured Mycolicibacterium sp.]|uniref:CoA transferase n=1 Tax=uncultured Mycolicibacterium sp. TaxID=2320817 RepID=UPI00260C304D|nr:CoA transferase [uncultured Mycolicibacterium sp.]